MKDFSILTEKLRSINFDIHPYTQIEFRKKMPWYTQPRNRFTQFVNKWSAFFSKDGVDSISGTFKKKYDWSNMGICIFVAFCGALELDLDDKKTRKFVQRVYKRAYTNRGGGRSSELRYIPWFNEILKKFFNMRLDAFELLTNSNKLKEDTRGTINFSMGYTREPHGFGHSVILDGKTSDGYLRYYDNNYYPIVESDQIKNTAAVTETIKNNGSDITTTIEMYTMCNVIEKLLQGDKFVNDLINLTDDELDALETIGSSEDGEYYLHTDDAYRKLYLTNEQLYMKIASVVNRGKFTSDINDRERYVNLKLFEYLVQGVNYAVLSERFRKNFKIEKLNVDKAISEQAEIFSIKEDKMPVRMVRQSWDKFNNISDFNSKKDLLANVLCNYCFGKIGIKYLAATNIFTDRELELINELKKYLKKNHFKINLRDKLIIKMNNLINHKIPTKGLLSVYDVLTGKTLTDKFDIY